MCSVFVIISVLILVIIAGRLKILYLAYFIPDFLSGTFWILSIFPNCIDFFQIVTTLNKELQRLNLPVYIISLKIEYRQSSFISGQLTENFYAKNTLKDHTPILIHTPKSIDKEVVPVKTLKR